MRVTHVPTGQWDPTGTYRDQPFISRRGGNITYKGDWLAQGYNPWYHPRDRRQERISEQAAWVFKPYPAPAQ